jgi:hypothetical protein
MGTPQNTAAIYVRRSAVDSANTEIDAFSRSLKAQERECLAWAEHQGLTVTEVSAEIVEASQSAKYGASHLRFDSRLVSSHTACVNTPSIKETNYAGRKSRFHFRSHLDESASSCEWESLI